MENSKCDNYLTCERPMIYKLLMTAAGMMGAYTFILRGGIFCNAQTANFVMMSIAFGTGNWRQGFYYFIPISAYFLGALISEIVPTPLKRIHFLRWDTLLVGLEIIVLLIIGFIPLTMPHQIVQVTINFICSMQYNTFRQAAGVPMATTFCTNHLRQFGIGIAKYLRKRDVKAFQKGAKHASMLLSFCLGGILLSAVSGALREKSIWIALIPLMIVFGVLVYADLIKESNLFDAKPSGH